VKNHPFGFIPEIWSP